MTALLGKSAPKDGDARSLVGHTEDVVEAAEALFGDQTKQTRLGERWLSFFKLDPANDWPTFRDTLLAACLAHDWGKANADMQAVLNRTGTDQLFRHEHLSALLLGLPGVVEWVKRRADIDWDVVLAAVASHHLKFSYEDFAPRTNDRKVQMHLDHDDFRGLVGLTADRLRLTGSPSFPAPKHWGFTGGPDTFDPTALRNKLRGGRLLDLDDECAEIDSHRARLLRAVRAALIVADAAGSGLRRTGQDIRQWVAGQFGGPDGYGPLSDEPFIQEIIRKRVEDLTARGKWEKWGEFQLACDALDGRALLLAPCGSGKTLAAWRWIAAQVKKQPVKRVLFLYPTRATATEGFKDYASWAPEDAAALVHGTAGYDLDGMFPAEDPRSKRESEDPRLFALRHWPKRVFSATADQFLAFMAYGYGPVCLLPLLADSVVVIDEVHSFDRQMLAAVRGFLDQFNVPVLCMTATLPEGRKQQLAAGRMEVANPLPDDLKAIADAPRYRINRTTEAGAEVPVRAAVRAGRRVLWVVNQVSRAQALTAKLADLPVPVICYHSRFTLDDRRDRHREVLGAIRAGEPAAVAVTTQVCEMSLDIDCDLLVTEECPIPSLIQRMGRCRRGRDELAAKGPGDVLVYKPDDKERVYSEKDRDGLDDFLGFVTAKGAASQSDLEAGLKEFGPKSADPDKLNSFLASGPYAVAGDDSFRDIEAFNVPAVLDEDVEEYLQAGPDRRPGFEVPVPRKRAADGPADRRWPRHLRVADARHYDPKTGFWDEPLR